MEPTTTEPTTTAPTTMDAGELDLVRQSIEAALSKDPATALDDLGWDDLLEAEPAVAVSELFEAQGRLGVETSALERLAGDEAAARRALAHELIGTAQFMIDQAATYVTDRQQFGRPIAAFQTVRHRLTEVAVAIASARAVLDAAWATGEPVLATAAKVLAGRAGHLAAKHCLQVTGAIGFTEEYGLAARMRRIHRLDLLHGSAEQLQTELGQTLLATGTVPRFWPLP